MRHYGALRTLMPITFVTFAAGYLAIIGFPSSLASTPRTTSSRWPSSAAPSWWSCAARRRRHRLYMTRLMLMTFVGKKRWKPDVHPHESPLVMTVPLIFLGMDRPSAAWCQQLDCRLARSRGRRRVPEEQHGLFYFSTTPRHAGRRRHRCCDQRVDLRTTSRNSDHSASEPVVPHRGRPQ
jgi:hypothetical protein